MSNKLVVDQMGREVEVPLAPRRIISLVPSQTELLLDLGLCDQLIGRTKFCVHPLDAVGDIAIIGGTKKLNMDRIHELQPDLIIGNKEENVEHQIMELAGKYPVWMSDIYDLSDALEMIRDLGSLLAVEGKAHSMAESISQGFEEVSGLISGSVVYLIWDKPIMGVGPETFIHEMIGRVGLTNMITTRRYPELSIKSLQEISPDYLFLSSEPFPYKDKHVMNYQELLPNTQVLLVDGEMFSWYGSRLIKSIGYFRELSNALT